MNEVELNWLRCFNYDEAKNHTGVIYLHEIADRPFYWGKADKSFFGGDKKEHPDGEKRSGRYGPSYKHWIEGCLKLGSKLYIAQIPDNKLDKIDDVENYLISKYGSELNETTPTPGDVHLIHKGDIPASITGAQTEIVYKADEQLATILLGHGLTETTPLYNLAEGQRNFKKSTSSQKAVYFDHSTIKVMDTTGGWDERTELTQEELKLILLFFELKTLEWKELIPTGRFDLISAAEALARINIKLSTSPIPKAKKGKLDRIIRKYSLIRLKGKGK